MQRFRKGKNPGKIPKRNAQTIGKKKRQFNVVLDEATYEKFSAACDRQNLTMTSVIRVLVEGYIQRHS